MLKTVQSEINDDAREKLIRWGRCDVDLRIYRELEIEWLILKQRVVF